MVVMYGINVVLFAYAAWVGYATIRWQNRVATGDTLHRAALSAHCITFA